MHDKRGLYLGRGVQTASGPPCLVGGPGGGGCNPLCNGVASFTATVDFSVSTVAGNTYTLMRGCYDEQHAAGMRRLGNTGAGQRPVTLMWKSLIPDGEVIGRPGLAVDGGLIVASAGGTLNKVRLLASRTAVR